MLTSYFTIQILVKYREYSTLGPKVILDFESSITRKLRRIRRSIIPENLIVFTRSNIYISNMCTQKKFPVYILNDRTCSGTLLDIRLVHLFGIRTVQRIVKLRL